MCNSQLWSNSTEKSEPPKSTPLNSTQPTYKLRIGTGIGTEVRNLYQNDHYQTNQTGKRPGTGKGIKIRTRTGKVIKTTK